MKQIFLAITLFSMLAILPVNIFAQQNPFPGCNFVLEDSECRSFLELSEAKAESFVKASDYSGQYHNYGIHVYYSSTLKSVTFYGTKPHSEYRRTFDGKPSKNFNWGDSADFVISNFRQPDSKKTWTTVTEFYYGENIVLEFKNGKLVSVTLTSRSTYSAPTTASNASTIYKPTPTPKPSSTVPIPNINDSEETRVNGLKEYYKQSFQKLGISVVKEGTAVNTSTRYYQLTVESTLETGYVYHFVAICPEKIFVSGDGNEYEEYFQSGSFGKSSVPPKYGLATYFYTAAYQGKNSSGAFTFKPTRQKVYWILFRSNRNSTKSKDEISQVTSEPLDEDLKRIQETEQKERGNYAMSGMTPEQRRKAAEALTKMNADEKKVNETANALIPVMNRKLALNQSFSKLYDKLQSDSKNRVTYALQMKKDAEEIVRICTEFLSKYGNELGKTDLPSLNAKVDVINQQIREMRSDIVANKKNIELLEKLISRPLKSS